jgi:hypothetical protein
MRLKFPQPSADRAINRSHTACAEIFGPAGNASTGDVVGGVGALGGGSAGAPHATSATISTRTRSR